MNQKQSEYKGKTFQMLRALFCGSAIVLAGAGFINKQLELKDQELSTFETYVDNIRVAAEEEIQQESVLEQKLSEESQSKDDYQTLQSFIGIPYGPVHPKKSNKKHLDCVSILYEFAQSKGIKLTGSRGDQIYARHTQPVSVLNSQNHDLTNIQTGDIIFIGHYFEKGEAGISAYHNAIVGKPIYDKNGNIIDYTMIHAAGSYGKNRAVDYHGQVKEESMLDYLNQHKSNSRKNHMFVGRLKK